MASAAPPGRSTNAVGSARAVKAWERLRRELRAASADGFAKVESPELVASIRAAWSAFTEAGGQLGVRPQDDAAFADGLARFDDLGRHDRSMIVAQGSRLCMGWAGRPPEVSARGQKVPRHRASSVAAASRPASVGTRRVAETETAAKKATANEAAGSEASGKKASGKKAASKKAASKKASSKKASSKKAPSKKAASKKASSRGRAAGPESADAALARVPMLEAGELPPSLGQMPVSVLPRVGPSTAAKLATRGLGTLEDLVFFLPSGYRDNREFRSPANVEDGEVITSEVTVQRFRQGFARGRFLATAETVADDGTPLSLRWFHRVGGLAQRVELGARIIVVGAVRDYRGTASIVHPEVYSPENPPPAIGVRYPIVEGVGARTISGLCQKALDRVLAVDALEDLLPAALAQAQGLPPLDEALRMIHAPSPALDRAQVLDLMAGRSPAHRRLAFGELFLLQLLLLRRRSHWCGDRASCVTPVGAFEREGVRACLPFEPTDAQWRVIDEIEQDMASGRPMLRLLQGDVGSGKTAVAFAAIRAAIAGGSQAALMAPTELLAGQHLRTLTAWCEAAGIKVALLTGSMPKAQRSTLLALLGAGKIDLLVGTHALLVADVAFRSLGLVVVDEQHRFGVEQRALLREKGERPHLLVMTATPIPRTLALTAYGELEVSIIDAMPPGREPPVTRLLTGRPALAKTRATVAKAVGRGAQVFVVCPLVEQSEVLDASHVEETAAALRALMPEVGVGIVHGRMSPEDKAAVMSDFRDGTLRVLVATTVIEVGVDIPGARAIAIEHAERFGLAQLHQLRGRVGRGGGASLCLIHTANGPASESAQRLRILTETSDGFVVAERDLALRGPGEIFGTRQAGVPRLRFLGFAGDGTKMLLHAREAAAQLLAEDPQLEGHSLLRAAIEQRERDAPVYSAEAG